MKAKILLLPIVLFLGLAACGGKFSIRSGSSDRWVIAEVQYLPVSSAQPTDQVMVCAYRTNEKMTRLGSRACFPVWTRSLLKRFRISSPLEAIGLEYPMVYENAHHDLTAQDDFPGYMIPGVK